VTELQHNVPEDRGETGVEQIYVFVERWRREETGGGGEGCDGALLDEGLIKDGIYRAFVA
jgi:hypothetical protein